MLGEGVTRFSGVPRPRGRGGQGIFIGQPVERSDASLGGRSVCGRIKAVRISLHRTNIGTRTELDNSRAATRALAKATDAATTRFELELDDSDTSATPMSDLLRGGIP